MATGSYVPNFHEGSRSEYLAQYIFSAFGPSVPVPHQEDHGIDLFCTLSERKGSRAWPTAYYSVQVKSTDESWTFEGPESVEWLLKYPAPLLLCIVDKKLAQVRIYQTTARFQAAVSLEPPSSIRLIPGIAGEGDVVHWIPDYEFGQRPDGTFVWRPNDTFELSAPILQFTVNDLMDEELFKVYRDILSFWIYHDLNNVRRQQMGMRSVWMISGYETNAVPTGGDLVSSSETYTTPEIRSAAEMILWEQLEWLGPVMLSDKDRVGALLVTLILRHLQVKNSQLETESYKPFLFFGLRNDGMLNGKLDISMGTKGIAYPFAPFDKLLKELRQRCTEDD
jgi:hypothetical protein